MNRTSLINYDVLWDRLRTFACKTENISQKLPLIQKKAVILHVVKRR